MRHERSSRVAARGAWFTEVYDYVASKVDWFANGLPREGTSAETPWAGDLVRDDAPTCAPSDRLGDVRDRVVAAGYGLCPVVNEQQIVLGLQARANHGVMNWLVTTSHGKLLGLLLRTDAEAALREG